MTAAPVLIRFRNLSRHAPRPTQLYNVNVIECADADVLFTIQVRRVRRRILENMRRRPPPLPPPPPKKKKFDPPRY